MVARKLMKKFVCGLSSVRFDSDCIGSLSLLVFLGIGPTALVQHAKAVSFIVGCIGKGYFLTGHSEKGYQFQNAEHTVKG